MYNIPIKHFYMVRHGETVANANRIMAGSLDTSLTPKGVEQAKSVELISRLLKIKPQSIIHSHLIRAKNTAEIINTSLKLPLHEIRDYAEMNVGDLQGLSYDLRGHHRAGITDMPNGESAKEFQDRVLKVKAHTLSTYTIPLIVCHGGVFRSFYDYYGFHAENIENCILHEYIPTANEETDFPWNVFTYSENAGHVTRQKLIL